MSTFDDFMIGQAVSKDEQLRKLAAQREKLVAALESVSATLRHGDGKRGGQLSAESLFAMYETVESTLNDYYGGANNRPEVASPKEQP